MVIDSYTTRVNKMLGESCPQSVVLENVNGTIPPVLSQDYVHIAVTVHVRCIETPATAEVLPYRVHRPQLRWVCRILQPIEVIRCSTEVCEPDHCIQVAIEIHVDQAITIRRSRRRLITPNC